MRRNTAIHDEGVIPIVPEDVQWIFCKVSCILFIIKPMVYWYAVRYVQHNYFSCPDMVQPLLQT